MLISAPWRMMLFFCFVVCVRERRSVGRLRNIPVAIQMRTAAPSKAMTMKTVLLWKNGASPHRSRRSNAASRMA